MTADDPRATPPEIDEDAIREWNAANLRARIAYLLEPTACADGCVKCDQKPGSSRHCKRCKETRRLRNVKRKNR